MGSKKPAFATIAGVGSYEFVDVTAGTGIRDAVREAVKFAKQSEQSVVFMFNGVPVVVRDFDTIGATVARYRRVFQEESSRWLRMASKKKASRR